MTKRSWMVMLCGLALGLASSVRAQNSNSGDIRGTVTDSSGAVVPGAKRHRHQQRYRRGHEVRDE